MGREVYVQFGEHWAAVGHVEQWAPLMTRHGGRMLAQGTVRVTAQPGQLEAALQQAFAGGAPVALWQPVQGTYARIGWVTEAEMSTEAVDVTRDFDDHVRTMPGLRTMVIRFEAVL